MFIYVSILYLLVKTQKILLKYIVFVVIVSYFSNIAFRLYNMILNDNKKHFNFTRIILSEE